MLSNHGTVAILRISLSMQKANYDGAGGFESRLSLTTWQTEKTLIEKSAANRNAIPYLDRIG